jgi:hypothetical protein
MCPMVLCDTLPAIILNIAGLLFATSRILETSFDSEYLFYASEWRISRPAIGTFAAYDALAESSGEA